MSSSKRNNNNNNNKKHESKTNGNDSNDDSNEYMTTRIWICSWNMASKEHFKMKILPDGRKVFDDDEISKLEQVIPTNYDIYVFGIQEGISDTYFQYIERYLSDFNVSRIPLTQSEGIQQLNKRNNNKKNKIKNRGGTQCFGVHGRGDGAFVNTKFTGLAIYYKRNLAKHITLKSRTAVSVGFTQGSKGAACVLLKIYSSTVAFLSSHMSSNNVVDKQNHFKILINKSGDKLGCPEFDLIQQFHHVVWFGDLNYRITAIGADDVLQLMATGQVSKLWRKDSLNIELQNNKACAFKNFIEPIPRLDFYPTYKKKPNRQLDFDQNPKFLAKKKADIQQEALSSLDKIYTTKYKEPIYKGGRIQDRVPSFCDRLLYHSLCKYASIYSGNKNRLIPEKDLGVLNCVEFSYGNNMNGNCDNYGVIPHNLMGSDHSAIYCGLKLISPLSFPLRPNELNDLNGKPKSYQLKIEDIKILRKSPYHSDGTYSEIPIKTKICFPAPYEIDNYQYKSFKPFYYQINHDDIQIYHNILKKIETDSKRRLSKQKKMKTFIKTNNNQNNIKTNILDDDEDDNDYVDDLNMNDNKIINNNDNLKSRKLSAPNMKAQPLPKNYLFVTEKAPEKKKSLPKGPPPPRPATQTDNNLRHSKNLSNIKEIENIQSMQYSKSVTISKSDLNKLQNKKNYHKNKKKEIGISKTNPLSQYLDSSDSEKDTTNGSHNHNHSYSQSQSKSESNSWLQIAVPTDEEMEHENNSKSQNPKLATNIHDNYFVENKNKTKTILTANAISPALSTGGLHHHNYNNINNTELNNKRSHSHSNSASLKRHRSKSVGSFNEDLNDIMGTKANHKISADNTTNNINDNNDHDNTILPSINATMNPQQLNHHNKHNKHKMHKNSLVQSTTSTNPSPAIPTMTNNNNKAIYRDLTEQSKKLTIITFGPSKRPNNGYIHCVLKVETADIKGQTTIPFAWDDFSKKIEDTQYAELFHHGIPLFDKTGSPIRLKIHYKLSLIDKQIIFDYNK